MIMVLIIIIAIIDIQYIYLLILITIINSKKQPEKPGSASDGNTAAGTYVS